MHCKLAYDPATLEEIVFGLILSYYVWMYLDLGYAGKQTGACAQLSAIT